MLTQHNFNAEHADLSFPCVAPRTPVKRFHYGILCQKLRPCAAKWKTIAGALGFFPGEIDNIQANPTNLADGPVSYMNDMLKVWMEKGPGDDRGSTDVATLEELVRAMGKANLGSIAQTLTLTDTGR